MPPGSKKQTRERPKRDSAADYRAKTAHESERIARRLKGSEYPAPLGDPASGVMLVVEGPVGPRAVDALERSLEALELPEAYVTWTSQELLEEILTCEPSALAALGPGAARRMDDLGYPLARSRFSEAEIGVWFRWTGGTAGLLVPALVPALDDEAEKKRFWQAFLALRDLPGLRA